VSAGGSVLSPTQLALLTAIQDRLIPREDDLPGAGEAGGAARVNAYLADRPEWRPDVLVTLEVIEAAAERVPDVRAVTVAATGATDAARITARTAGPATADEPSRAAFLALPDDERDAVLQGVEASHPRPFQRLLRLTYNAYYTDPAIRRAGGFEADPPQPGGYAIPPFDESRLEPIKRRGKLWRDA